MIKYLYLIALIGAISGHPAADQPSAVPPAAVIDEKSTKEATSSAVLVSEEPNLEMAIDSERNLDILVVLPVQEEERSLVMPSELGKELAASTDDKEEDVFESAESRHHHGGYGGGWGGSVGGIAIFGLSQPAWGPLRRYGGGGYSSGYSGYGGYGHGHGGGWGY